MKQVLFFLFSLSVIEIAKANDPVIAQKSGEYQLTYSPFFGSFQSKAISDSTISLSLKNNEVDLSSVFKIIDQLRESDYAGDLQKMEHVISDLRFQGREIERLCEKSSSKNSCIQNSFRTL